MLHNLPHRHSLSKRQQGFTLIELLMVIAVILILTGITFGITRGVQNAQARAKAKAELATISLAIEQFKSRYGDYPWHKGDVSNSTGNNKMLLYALTGRLVLRPKSNSTTGAHEMFKVGDDLDQPDVQKNPKFIDVTRFSVQEVSGQSVALLDPWGNAYRYLYKSGVAPGLWEVFGYHLYSIGADSVEDSTQIQQSPRTGEIKDTYRDAEENIDNIFAGE